RKLTTRSTAKELINEIRKGKRMARQPNVRRSKAKKIVTAIIAATITAMDNRRSFVDPDFNRITARY
ncbi:MAG: hypothetical protein H0X46_08645, partial [Bacteroidetes bacterium]|nr:hypothetical protein [Bacteroidota bacterium]